MLEFYCDRQASKYLSLRASAIVFDFQASIRRLLEIRSCLAPLFSHLAALLLFLLATSCLQSVARAQTKIAIDVLDKATGDKVAARVEFTQPAGRGPKPRKSLTAGNQILFEVGDWLTPTPGSYEFTVRRGPEFQDVKAGFTLERNAKDVIEVVVPHKTPMRLFGWYSGDLHSAIQIKDLRRWMRADDLDIVATTAERAEDAIAKKEDVLLKHSDSGEIDISADISADTEKIAPLKNQPPRTQPTAPLNAKGESDWTKTPCPEALGAILEGSKFFAEPEMGGILLHRLSMAGFNGGAGINKDEGSNGMSPKDIFDILDEISKTTETHVELTRPWERNVPLILASEKIHSVQLLSDALKPGGATALSSKIRNPDSLRFKGTKGLGRLSEYIYWQMLEAGLRLPLSAGSGFTEKGDTVLGYNRVYVFLEDTMNPDAQSWWKQLRRGASIVTNGPLINLKVNGLAPGSIIPGYRDQPIALDIELDLTVRDPVEYLDIVFNGKSIYQARLEDHARRGSFPEIEIRESGWLLIRVVTEHQSSYRLATTSPYYFDFEQPRVSRKAVEFFQDWLAESVTNIQNDAKESERYRQPIAIAEKFWKEQLEKATVD